MTTSVMPTPLQRYFTNSGTPAAGCKLYTYAAGTATPKQTFQDAAGLVPHTNPITLDAKGEALIYWSGNYKVDLKTASGVQITGYPVNNFQSYDSVANNAATDLLRSELAAAAGAALIAGGVAMQTAAITTFIATGVPDGAVIFARGRSAAGDGGGGIFRYSSASAQTVDGGLVFAPATGTGRLLRDGWTVFGFVGAVNVVWFGAKPGDDTLAVAQANTVAFRAACLSMKTVWTAWKTSLQSRSVYVPPGDYNLSNGFTVPQGCAIYGDGTGTARLKVLVATADVTNVLPLVSLGRVINDTTFATEVATGAYVTNPAPEIDRLYLNPQNAGTALSVIGVAGFVIGKLWLQANICVDLDSSDGLIDTLVCEDSSVVALQLGDSQNITIKNLYTFALNSPIIVNGNCQNIDIGIVQANYTKIAVIATNDGVSAGRIRIGDLVCNQNEQYAGFTSVIRTRSVACDISIGNMDARNYNGYAIDNETGLGNVVSVDRMKLRQTPNNPVYALGTTAAGVRVNNSDVRIGHLDASGLSDSPVNFDGAFASRLEIGSGRIGTYVAANEVVKISNTLGSCVVALNGIDNASGKALFNSQAYITPKYFNIKTPFPIVDEGGRYAIKIPFIGSANAWEVSIVANTAVAGNALYRRVKTLMLAQETGFDTALATGLYAATALNSGFTAGFTPDIAHQLDVGTVAAGATVAYVANGAAVVSVPNTYAGISFGVRQL